MRVFLTKKFYKESDNLDEIIKKDYGPYAEILDTSMMTSEIMKILKTSHYGVHGITHCFVKHKNSLKYSSNRYYFLEAHFQRPQNFLSHHCFLCDNTYFNVGSWFDLYMPVLVFILKPKIQKTNSECCICLEPIKEKSCYCRLNCCNTFHLDCVKNLRNCPLCRSPLYI